ncbi:MAG TPA: SbcC/MukB-like Walker B domain-containing protein [bacterium]|nr:SbcC/MukB-like Walker B domain-containing protein [bacterium]
MKILKIRLKNLNSLKGFWEIEFDKPPLSETGIFAIVGQTGSGKSTILDAITLGLFGQTFRLSKQTEFIMTKHTSDCFSEVEFSVNQQKYCSKWSARRARNKSDGALQPPKMELVDLNVSPEIIIEDKLSETPKKIEQITGFDFKRFVRSVILSQGDFAAFLNSGVNERAELLEKLTGAEIYSALSKLCYSKRKEEENSFELTLQKLDELKVLDADSEKKVKDEFLKSKEELKNLEVKEQVLFQKISNLETIEKLNSDKKRISEKLENVQKNLFEKSNDFLMIPKFDSALDLKKYIDKIEELNGEADNAASANKKFKSEIDLLNEKIISFKNQINELEKHNGTDSNQLKTYEILAPEIIRIDSAISKTAAELNRLKKIFNNETSVFEKKFTDVKSIDLINEKNSGPEKKEPGIILNDITSVVEKIKGLIKSIEETETEKNKTKLELSKKNLVLKSLDEKYRELSKNKEIIENKSNDLKKLLNDLTEKKRGILEGLDIDKIESDYEKIQNEIQITENSINLLNEFIIKQKEQEENILNAEQINKSFEADSIELKKLEKIEEELESQTEKIRGQLEQFILISKYEEDRKYLKQGDLCPLCGSRSHPLTEGGINEKISSAKDYKKILKEFAEKISRIKETKTEKKAACIYKQNQTSDISKKNLKIDSELKQLADKISGFVGIDKSSDKQSALDEALSQKKNLSEKTLKYKKILNEYKRLKKIEDESTKLFIDYQNKSIRSANDLNDLNNKLSTLKNEMENLKKNLDSGVEFFERQIQSYSGFKFEIHSLFEDCAVSINLLKNERFKKFSGSDIEDEIKKLSAKILINTDKMKVMQAEYETDRQAVERKTGGIENNEKKLSEIKIQTENEVIELQKKLALFGFQSSEELKNILSISDKIRILKEEKKLIDETIAKYEVLLGKINSDIQNELNKNIGDTDSETAEGLKIQLNELKSSKNKALENLKISEFAIIKNEETKTKRIELMNLSDMQKKELNKWRQMDELIGSADGKKFRKFAQTLTFEKLTVLANKHLIKLNDRYYLETKESAELDFEIIDSYQANARRPVSTLSGGETFLVSLALALGLSDIASRKMKVESLFIDEGFGSLDSDALDSALSVVENLQLSGKTVGVISHIDSVKERIPVQIKIDKMSGGISRLRVV